MRYRDIEQSVALGQFHSYVDGAQKGDGEEDTEREHGEDERECRARDNAAEKTDIWILQFVSYDGRGKRTGKHQSFKSDIDDAGTL